MKKSLLGVLILASFSANAQLTSGDIDNIADQLKYDDGLKIKKDTKAEVDPLVWDVETVDNTLNFKKKPKAEDIEKHVKVSVTYDDLSKSKPRITQIHQSVARKDGDKLITERVLTVNVSKQRVQDASLCEVKDDLDSKSKFECVTVDKPFCYDLKQAMKKADAKSEHLKKCADSLSKMNDVIASGDNAVRLAGTSSRKKTFEVAGGESRIATSNGGIMGSNIAKKGGIALGEIFKMVSLCEDNNLGKNRGKLPTPIESKESQSQKEE